MGWFFLFFFVSGFCSILYEIVWLRLSMAQFGVTTATVSIVLSVFMGGLGLGSWGAGHTIQKYRNGARIPALRLYGLAELLIGISALAVPAELLVGRNLLEQVSTSSSLVYYLLSAVWVALTLIPWCACMGATIPLAMLAINRRFQREAHRSFSFLYLANVLGAVVGATVPLLLIEIYGFRGALKFGALLNGLLFMAAMGLSFRWSISTDSSRDPASIEDQLPRESPMLRTSTRPSAEAKPLVLLFLGGLTSMGAEVAWIRLFTPYLSTVVYAFAAILGVYLAATFIGSRVYRYWSRTHAREGGLVWGTLGFVSLLPLLTASPHFLFPEFHSLLRLVVGIGPFSAVLGFVTPMLVDRWSGGNPNQAGKAYAVNVAGCILGPLVAGFILLPFMSERWVLFVFALPWLIIGVVPRWSVGAERAATQTLQLKLSYALAGLALVAVFILKGLDDYFAQKLVLRDNTATVVATGDGMNKRLLVNGIGITQLTPITKVMAHLPLAFLNHTPRNALVVCFGMGTTYRSLMSWNIQTTAVELVPSVPQLFWYYHSDGVELLRSPLSRIVIDDGRRYLERTSEQYDVITIDPPPPVEAAGTSLLYSKEFYSIIGRRLSPGGILQQWLPWGDVVVKAAVARALKESFPYVRLFHALDGVGFHFLASNQPIALRTPAELAKRMPAAAAQDLVEWGPEATPEGQFAVVLSRELSLDQIIAGAPGVPALQDDRPENEYYVLRRKLPEAWLSRMSVPH
jgi:spermidine synthase